VRWSASGKNHVHFGSHIDFLASRREILQLPCRQLKQTMNKTLSLLTIALTLAFSACSSQSGSRKVEMGVCDSDAKGKKVMLQQNAFADGGRVVRLANPTR
jgi:hypothetical protein